MATRWIRDKTLNQIAETIRDTISGSESTLTMRPGEMPDLIRNIPTAATTVTNGDGMVATAGNITNGYVAFVNGEKIIGTSTIGNTITETNITIAQTYATYTVTADPGYAFKTVTVAPIVVPTVSVTPISVTSTLATQTIAPPAGYNGFDSVTVNGVTRATVTVQSRYHEEVWIPNRIVTDIHISAIPTGYEDVTNVTASAADILPSKVIVNSAGQTITGSMYTKSATTSYISNKNQVVTVTAGQYLSGAQTIGISSTERDKIISQNIAAGVTILGVSGTHGSQFNNWPYDGTTPYSFWADDVVNDFDNLNDYNGFDGLEFLNLCANIANQNSLTNGLKTCFRCFALYQYEDVISKLYFTNSDNYSLYRLANDCVYIAQYITGHELSDLTLPLSGSFSLNHTDILAYTLYYWIIQNSLIDSKFNFSNYYNFRYETPFIYNFPSLHDIIYYDTNPSNFVNLSSNIDFILPINLPIQLNSNSSSCILFTPYFDTFDSTISSQNRYSSNIWFSLYIDNMYCRCFHASENNNTVLREDWVHNIYSSELDSTAIIPYTYFDPNQYYGTLSMVAYHKGSYDSYNQPNVIKNFIALPEFAMTLTL